MQERRGKKTFATYNDKQINNSLIDYLECSSQYMLEGGVLADEGNVAQAGRRKDAPAGKQIERKRRIFKKIPPFKREKQYYSSLTDTLAFKYRLVAYLI